MEYNLYDLPTGSLQIDNMMRDDNIYLIFRYIASMYSGSQFETRNMYPTRYTQKLSVGSYSPSSSMSGSVEHQMTESILFRVLGDSGSAVVQQRLTVGDINLDTTASMYVSGTVRITGGAPFSGAVLTAISSSGHAIWSSGSGGGLGGQLLASGNMQILFNSASLITGSNQFIYNYINGIVYLSGSFSASVAPNVVGYIGTSSWAQSSSQAISSSYAFSSSYSVSSSYADYSPPGGSDKQIQFNSSSHFSGSTTLTFNYDTNNMFLSGTYNVLGNQRIHLSGSTTASLWIKNLSASLSTLENLPFLTYAGPNVGSPFAASRRLTQALYVPSSSTTTFGQVWNLVDTQGYLHATHIFDITSSNGDLRFRGSIGGSAQDGRHRGYGIYASNIDKVLILANNNSPYVDKLVAYDPNVIGVQPIGFTASINSAYELSLIDYSCSFVNSSNQGVEQVAFGYIPNPIIYSPSASIQYYSIFGYATSSLGRAAVPLTPGTSLSSSIQTLVAANSDISGAAASAPIGFFMSTFDGTTPSTRYVELTADLLANGVAANKLITGSHTGGIATSVTTAYTIGGAYNSTLNKIYCIISLLNNGGNLGVFELDNNVNPPQIVSAYTGSGASSGLNYFATYNSVIQQLAILTNLPFAGGTYSLFDASTSPINWNISSSTTISSVPAPATRLVPISNSFYGISYLNSASIQTIYQYQIQSSSTGYNTTSASIATTYKVATMNQQYPSDPTYATSIDKIITIDTSQIGPIDDTSSVDENGETLIARAGYMYVVSTSSLAVSAIFNPYITASYPDNRKGNFIEFVDYTGSILSYVDRNGKFIGTASYADTVGTASLAIRTLTSSYTETSFSSSYALTSSYVLSSSYALTSSYNLSASYALTSSYVLSSSYALSASYVLSSSYATTASFVISASLAANVSVSVSNTNAAHYVHFGNQSSGSDNIEVNGRIQYNPGLSTLTLTAAPTLSLDSYGLLRVEKGSDVILAGSNVDPTHLYVNYGTTFLNSSGNLVLSVSGSQGNLLSVSDDINENIFQIDFNNTTTVLAVRPTGLYISGNIDITGSNVSITGSLQVQHGITGSLYGTASWAISASIVTSASYATSASYTLSSSYALSASNARTSSYVISASYAATSSFVISASYAISASSALTASFTLSSSYAITASFYNSPTNVNTVNRLLIDSVGGNSIDYGTRTLINSANITMFDWENGILYNDIGAEVITLFNNNINDNGNISSLNWQDRTLINPLGIVVLNWSGSIPVLHGIASSSISASYATTASFNISSSYANSSSYALTASYVAGVASTTKAGSASVASFVGFPFSCSVIFNSAFSDNLYAVSVIGEDSRVWSIASKSAAGFIIDTNSSTILTNPVYWIATPFNS